MLESLNPIKFAEIYRPTILFVLFLTVIFTFFGCKNSPILEDEAIEPEEFIQIIKDIHLTDGVITVSGLNKKLDKEDTISFYNYVFKKHKVTKSQFDQTVAYYCNHPQKYKLAYNKVIAELNEMKDFNEGVSKIEKKPRNINDIWNKKANWSLPKDGAKATIPFTIKTDKKGVFTLSAYFLIYPNDQTNQPRMTMTVFYADGTKETKENGTLNANGKKEKKELFIITAPGKKVTSIKGWVYNHSSGTGIKHAEITNIELINPKEM